LHYENFVSDKSKFFRDLLDRIDYPAGSRTIASLERNLMDEIAQVGPRRQHLHFREGRNAAWREAFSEAEQKQIIVCYNSKIASGYSYDGEI
jgi:hypothetical protein